MDQVERNLEEIARERGDQLDVGTPNPDGPGNAAWQQVKQLLAKVHHEEDARRRRN